MIKYLLSELFYFYWVLIDNNPREREFMKEQRKYRNIKRVKQNRGGRMSLSFNQTLYEAKLEAKEKKNLRN